MPDRARTGSRTGRTSAHAYAGDQRQRPAVRQVRDSNRTFTQVSEHWRIRAQDGHCPFGIALIPAVTRRAIGAARAATPRRPSSAARPAAPARSSSVPSSPCRDRQHLALLVRPGHQVAAVVGQQRADLACRAGAARRSTAASSSSMPAPVRAETTTAAALGQPQALDLDRVGRVGLVDHHELGHVAGADLAEHLADGGQLGPRVRRREPSTTCRIRSASATSSSVDRNASTSWCGRCRTKPDRVGQGEPAGPTASGPAARPGPGWRTASRPPARRPRSAGSAGWTCRRWCSRRWPPTAPPGGAAGRAVPRGPRTSRRSRGAAWPSGPGSAAGRSRSWSRRGRGSPMPPPAATRPPACRDSDSPQPRSRGSRYSSWASSTCALPSLLRACWAKMSRISAVRSMTLTRTTPSSRRSWPGVSSPSQITVSAPVSVTTLGQLARLARADVGRRVRPAAALDQAVQDLRTRGLGQPGQLAQRVLRVGQVPSVQTPIRTTRSSRSARYSTSVTSSSSVDSPATRRSACRSSRSSSPGSGGVATGPLSRRPGCAMVNSLSSQSGNLARPAARRLRPRWSHGPDVLSPD